MRALTWQGNSDVRVEDVPDPTIQQPTDAIVRVTSTAICGSDLHTLKSGWGPTAYRMSFPTSPHPSPLLPKTLSIYLVSVR